MSPAPAEGAAGKAGVAQRWRGRVPARRIHHEAAGFNRYKIQRFAEDGIAGDPDGGAVDLQQVEIIVRPALARGQAGARLHLQNRVAAGFFGKGRGLPAVQMPGEDHIGLALRQRLQRRSGPAHRLFAFTLQLFQRVMRHHDARLTGLGGVENPLHAGQCAGGEPAALMGQDIHRVHAQNDHLVIAILRFQIARDPAPVMAPGPDQAEQEIVQRHIVIAGHGQGGRLQPVDEPARGAELAQPGALGQIAGNGHQIRRQRVDRRDQRLGQFRAVAAEMQVGQMHQPSHRTSSCCAAGTITVSSSSITRNS